MLHVQTLIKKLEKIGIMGEMLTWIKKFLTKRTFTVKVGVTLSPTYDQQNGTPQGTIISPLLFLIMINGLKTDINQVDLIDAEGPSLHQSGITLRNIILNTFLCFYFLLQLKQIRQVTHLLRK
jgi:hypothetical protein